MMLRRNRILAIATDRLTSHEKCLSDTKIGVIVHAIFSGGLSSLVQLRASGHRRLSRHT